VGGGEFCTYWGTLPRGKSCSENWGVNIYSGDKRENQTGTKGGNNSASGVALTIVKKEKKRLV